MRSIGCGPLGEISTTCQHTQCKTRATHNTVPGVHAVLATAGRSRSGYAPGLGLCTLIVGDLERQYWGCC